jgi:hypothetical protein
MHAIYWKNKRALDSPNDQPQILGEVYKYLTCIEPFLIYQWPLLLLQWIVVRAKSLYALIDVTLSFEQADIETFFSRMKRKAA